MTNTPRRSGKRTRPLDAKRRTADPDRPGRARRIVRALARGVRNVAVFFAIVGLVVGWKALQNRRDVVEVGPREQAVAALAVAYPDAYIVDPYDVPDEWFKVQLHVHTDQSLDGRWSVDEALAAYAERGYDFVAITDHDKVTTPGRIPDGLVVIPGEENTVSFPFWPLGQHAIHLFADGHVKRGSSTVRFEQMQKGGGLVSIAHPHWPGNLGSGYWELKHLLATSSFTLMEVSNPYSNSTLDTQIWHETVLRRGPKHPVWAVAVDDAHDYPQVDRAWTMVRAEEHSLTSLRQALQRGSLYATTGVLVSFGAEDDYITVRDIDDGSPSDESSSAAAVATHRVLFIDSTATVVAEHVGPLPAAYRVTGREGFIRIELFDVKTGKRAWSQPFWILPSSDAL